MKESNRRYGWWLAALLLAVGLLSVAAVQAQDTPPVSVSVTISGTALPGHAVKAKANVTVNDGSHLQSFDWTQTGGVDVTINGSKKQTATVNLPNRTAYRKMLAEVTAEPPVTQAQLPDNVPLPPGEFPAGLQDRFYIVGINPFNLEEAGLVTLDVAVTTSSGTYHGTGTINSVLPYRTTTGVPDVPINVPVLLQGKTQNSYDWRVITPSGSSAKMIGAGQRNPEFTPDVAGVYEVRVTDQAAAQTVKMKIYAGTWRGIIVGQDQNGRPVAESLCTGCHNNDNDPFIAPDEFTPWAQTGHAEIFTQNLNTSTHYSTECFQCHTVGYDPTNNNGGVDEAPDFQDFLNAGLLNNPSPNNWTMVLNNFPATAQLSNIQCENCHGPQNGEPGRDSMGHGLVGLVDPTLGHPRVSLSAEVCGSCHGEPLRHGRYQQWQLSKHADYPVAIAEGTNGSCARCHTANGFLTWLPILLGEEPGDPLANITVTWTADEVHPQTCQTCHDPHAIGTTSGDEPNARVRISGDTPDLIAGFKVIGAGKGAICMTCHNSRRGLKNDATFDQIKGTSSAGQAPHPGVQTDILMGENGYGVNTGVRGPHSLIRDTCVQCHMEKTPPPDVLSYQQGGTNHTFFASPEICQECHGEVMTADVIQGIVEEVLGDVEQQIGDAYLQFFKDQISKGYSIKVGGTTITSGSSIKSVALTDTHGSQGLIVTLKGGGGPLDAATLSSIMVLRPAPLAALPLTSAADDGLLKAGWNYLMVESDGSLGAHNPRFVLELLDAARDLVGGADSGGPRVKILDSLPLH